MSVLNNAQFAEQVLKMAQSAPPFEPGAIYDPDGDCIEFLIRPDPFFAERIDDLVTVYYQQDTREIIGSVIKGVARLCQRLSEKMPAFKIEVQDGPMKLEHLLFLAKLLESPEQAGAVMVPTLSYRRKVYDQLIEAAEQTDARAELAHVGT